MYPYKQTKIYVSPWAAVLLALFILFSSPLLLAALLFAALCHELGHYIALQHLGGWVESIHISAFGAEMRLGNRNRLSYGGEMLTVAAGPIVNIALAFLLATAGKWAEFFYLFAGAQIVLGLFNLLPVLTLDGGTLIWLLAAWLADPYVADRICKKINLIMIILLLVCGGLLMYYENGSPFLLLGAVGVFWSGLVQKRLVKRSEKR